MMTQRNTSQPFSCTRAHTLFKTSIVCILASLFTLGCEESVNTRLDIERPFSIFGILNPKADTHAVRVFEIEGVIRLVQPDPIDAVVSSTLMQTGATQAWQDSVVVLPSGTYRHVYWSNFAVKAGETYRLEVVRSDGASVSAETTIPPPVSLEILDPDTLSVRNIIQPLIIRGAPPSLPRIDVEYVAVGINLGTGLPVFKPITFNYAGKPMKNADGWLLELDLRADFVSIFEIFDASNELSTQLIDLKEIKVHVHVGDENWVSPVGVFDAEVLVEPGSFSNVENGFGYFGAGYVESITFRPKQILLDRAGFLSSDE